MAANIDESTGALRYPRGANSTRHQALITCLEWAERETEDHGLSILSFDIDLTLATGDQDEEGPALIHPAEISRLKRLGYIVGTCSDREPSDQLRLMETLGQHPHFAIPNEHLAWTQAAAARQPAPARRRRPGTGSRHGPGQRLSLPATGGVHPHRRGPHELWPGSGDSQKG